MRDLGLGAADREAACGHLDLDAHGDPRGFDGAEHLRVLVAHPQHPTDMPDRRIREQHERLALDAAVAASGIASPWGSKRGRPQAGVDALEQSVADGVLEYLGLVVHLVPAVAELLYQPGLDQPVPAHHGEGAGGAGLRQSHRHRRARATRVRRPASFFTISVTDDGAMPSFAASTEGVIGASCHSVCA